MKTRKWLYMLSFVFWGLAACTMPSAEHAGHDHSAAVSEDPERISIDQVLARMQQGDPIVFLDSRRVDAWDQATTKIPGAIRVGNNEQLAAVMLELPRDSFIVTYCT